MFFSGQYFMPVIARGPSLLRKIKCLVNIYAGSDYMFKMHVAADNAYY